MARLVGVPFKRGEAQAAVKRLGVPNLVECVRYVSMKSMRVNLIFQITTPYNNLIDKLDAYEAVCIFARRHLPSLSQELQADLGYLEVKMEHGRGAIISKLDVVLTR